MYIFDYRYNYLTLNAKFQINDILNNVKNNINNMVDKIKLENKLDMNEKTDLKPNGIGRKQRCHIVKN